jgi:CheY-like chemotaxis protein
MTEPRTLVLVDDQPDFLEVVRGRLTRNGTLVVVGEATTGEAALELVAQLTPSPEGVLLDVEMPGLDGFETARRLRLQNPTLPIILTSASNNPRYSAAASGIGAAFLPKRDLTATAVVLLLDAARQ